MSDNPFQISSRSNLSGATRPSANPRVHQLSKPYSRPSSYAGPSVSTSAYGLNAKPIPSPGTGKMIPSNRRQLPTSTSFGSLPRSESEGSLFSGLKSMLTKPLQWLATPSRSIAKRDSTSFGGDMEDPESPTDRRGEKRLRRISPTRTGGRGDYAPPEAIEVEGRAVLGTMLPPLPPNVSLSNRTNAGTTLANSRTNFSRPLPNSRSMPYLDPPSAALGNTPRRGAGVLTRSKRMELLGTDDDAMDMVVGEKGKGKEKETADQWSPWNSNKYSSVKGRMGTPAKMGTPNGNRDYSLPSVSPFKMPPSPSHPREPSASISGLTRSNTFGHARGTSSVMSDISMGRDSASGVRRSGSMLFSSDSVNGDKGKDDRMSVDGERDRPRDGSVSDWFMRDRWSANGGMPGSPSSRAASVRLGGTSSFGGPPSIRKGQLVWDADKGFVRESDLRAENPAPIHANDAERILFALEAVRKTPLAEARRITGSSSILPPELIGASTRSIRKAISVPLATSQAGDTAKARRERERGEDKDLSIMISPYGRRRQVDKAAREARMESEAGESESDFRPSKSPTPSHDRHSESSSRASTDHMDISDRDVSASPQPTPRRSSRLRRGEHEEEATPKAKKTSKSKAPPSSKKKMVDASAGATPKKETRQTRKPTADKGTSPPPTTAKNLPIITETAPSPQSQSQSSYQPRADGDLPRGASSLRARSDTKRQHVGAATLSRSVSPTGAGGRYSAREEDLPPIEELEQAKIALPSNSFSGINFGNFGVTPVAAKETPSYQSQPTSVPLSQPAQASPSANRLSVGPLSRLSAPRLRQSSPLASGNVVSAADSPPETNTPAEVVAPQQDDAGFFRLSQTPGAGIQSTTPAKEPPVSLFAGIGNKSESSADGPKKTLGFGFGQPPAVSTPKLGSSGGMPDFFSSIKSASGDGTTTPAAEPPKFTFAGITPAAPVASSTSTPMFGLPKTGTLSSAPLANGSTVFNFDANANKPADPPKPALFFGASAAKQAEVTPSTLGLEMSATSGKSVATAETPALSFFPSVDPVPVSKTAEPPKSPFTFSTPATPAPVGFNFMAPQAVPKPIAEPPKTSFFSNLNATANGAASPATSGNTPNGGIDFGKPAGSIPSAIGFGFGSGGATKRAAEDSIKSPPPPSNPFGSAAVVPASNGFFGSTPSASGASQLAATPFGAAGNSSSPFGASTQRSTSAPQPNGISAFGAKPATNGNFFGTTTPAAPANVFGAAATPSTNSSTSFNFPTNPAPQSNGFGAPAANNPNPFAFNTPNPSPVASNPFQFNQPTPAPTTPNGGSFAFGTPTSSTPTFTFGAGTPAAAPATAPPFGFGGSPAGGVPGFGGSPAPADGGFSMGIAADAQAPGSPGARKIKGLRKTVKR